MNMVLLLQSAIYVGRVKFIYTFIRYLELTVFYERLHAGIADIV